jgi:hypothetical protein
VSEPVEEQGGPTGPLRSSTWLYVILAVVLVAVIAVLGFFLVTNGLVALRGGAQPTAAAELTVTLAPTFTPGPTKEPTYTPPPSPSPTAPTPEMRGVDAPAFTLVSAGGRPGAEWTGFFGQVTDAQGKPLSGISVIVWYSDGTPASPIVKTDQSGSYEIRLADAPLAGTWTIQLLMDDGQPASQLLTFNTDENTQSGIQQIQVLWQKVS